MGKRKKSSRKPGQKRKREPLGGETLHSLFLAFQHICRHHVYVPLLSPREFSDRQTRQKGGGRSARMQDLWSKFPE